jgi:hypothetical protein
MTATALDLSSLDVPAAPGPVPAGTDASSLSARLGLSDPTLDEGKKEGAGIELLQAAAKKRPKMTHGLFFEDDKGLKKMLRTFPSIKFRGKGREYEDVTLLLQHYKRWFDDLYPYGEHFEDLVWKARQVLQDKEKDDEGVISDPRERLHAFRFQYKNAATGAHLSEEVRARIEANRKRALELKRQKEGGSGAGAAQPQELDMDELWRMEQEHAAASKSQAQGATGFAVDDEEEDPFGYGGAFDMDESVGASKTSKPAAFAFEEEEDVFGYGGGFDDEPDRPQAPPKAPQAPSKTPDEMAKAIAENRAKALERKAAMAADKSSSAVTVPTEELAADSKADESTAAPVSAQDPADMHEGTEAENTWTGMDDEDDVFDFGGAGFDDA